MKLLKAVDLAIHWSSRNLYKIYFRHYTMYMYLLAHTLVFMN